LEGSVTAIFLQGTPPGAPPCASNPIGVDPPRYFEFSMLHEILHTMGFVPTCAPHTAPNHHVSDGRFNLMWSGNAPWMRTRPSRRSSAPRLPVSPSRRRDGERSGARRGGSSALDVARARSWSTRRSA
jgi:hypothetical protein